MNNFITNMTSAKYYKEEAVSFLCSLKYGLQEALYFKLRI